MLALVILVSSDNEATECSTALYPFHLVAAIKVILKKKESFNHNYFKKQNQVFTYHISFQRIIEKFQ